MTWGKLDDRLDDNEKFAGLSLSAAGLWLMCMPRALRNDDGFVPEAHALRFLSPTGRHSGRVLFRELVGAGLWEEVEGGWLIHDFTKYAAPSTNSAERVRRYRERKKAEKAQEAGQSNALQPLLKRDVTPLARARTRRVIPDPEPVPVNSLFPSVRVSTDQPEIIEASDPVGAFVDACKALGLTAPDGRTKGRVGAEAKRLIADGKPVELVLEGCKELARRNASPTHLAYITGDIERHRKGIDTSRRQPTQNPVSREIQSFTAFSDAEERGERL